MKSFIIKTALFIIGVIVIDNLLGLSFDYLKENAKGGATYRDNYISNEMTCDVLLVGSSRCEHHYNPQIIEDSLLFTSYNAGQSGNGIIVAYARYLMMCEREKPQKVIYDINPDFDLLAGFDNHRYLTWLRSYYYKDYVKDIFESIDKTEKYKMLSHMYCYNSRFIEILIDFLHPIEEKSIKGYVPYNSEMDYTKIDSKEIEKHIDHYDFDPLKLDYINRFIDAVGEENIIIVISPRWYGLDEGSYKPLVDICNKKEVKFLDFSNAPKYVHNDLFFRDGTHLNARGADEFTRELIQYIK